MQDPHSITTAAEIRRGIESVSPKINVTSLSLVIIGEITENKDGKVVITTMGTLCINGQLPDENERQRLLTAVRERAKSRKIKDQTTLKRR